MLKVDYRPLVQRLQKVLNDKKRLNFELSFTIQSFVAKIYKFDLLVCCQKLQHWDILTRLI